MKVSKRKSVLQERRVAQDVDGRIQPGSGAPQFYKGDVRKAGEIRIECKTTGAKSFALKQRELEKIRNEALMGGDEDWAMQVQFQGQFTNKKYAVIDWEEFLQLRQLKADQKFRMKSAADYMRTMGEADAAASRNQD